MKRLRKDFPLLKQKVNGHSLIYFDNAATSQKPKMVIDAVSMFYAKQNNNIHRAVYALGEQATTLYEQARNTVAQFINAEPEEIIFTKGTTEAINFVASTWARKHIKKGDSIVLTELEHHSNMIPWQQRAQENKAVLKYIPVRADGTLALETVGKIIQKNTKLVAAVHVSNATGAHTDIGTIIKAAHNVGARVLIDAAQSVPHQKIDVKELQCDFLAFSGHKMLGPTGIGVLYIKKELHEQIPPYQFGGGMIYEADYHHATWQEAPHKFEAGTPPIAQAVGLAAAIDYFNKNISFQQLQNHEAQLCSQLIDGLLPYKKIRILGPIEELKQKGHLVSFVIEGMHAHDIAAHLSQYGICVRAGNHCAQPLAKKLNIIASIRASFFVYNTQEEVEKFLKAIRLLMEK